MYTDIFHPWWEFISLNSKLVQCQVKFLPDTGHIPYLGSVFLSKKFCSCHTKFCICDIFYCVLSGICFCASWDMIFLPVAKLLYVIGRLFWWQDMHWQWQELYSVKEMFYFLCFKYTWSIRSRFIYIYAILKLPKY